MFRLVTRQSRQTYATCVVCKISQSIHTLICKPPMLSTASPTLQSTRPYRPSLNLAVIVVLFGDEGIMHLGDGGTVAPIGRIITTFWNGLNLDDSNQSGKYRRRLALT